MSRSNVSTSLRELITWGVVRRVHIIGDRRDRFEALKDVMETFRVIMAERKRREMDPTIALLEHCVHEAKVGDPSEQYTREQLEKMLEFTRMVTDWYSHIDNLSTPALLRLFRGGAMLAKIFGRSKTRDESSRRRPGPARSPDGVPGDRRGRFASRGLCDSEGHGRGSSGRLNGFRLGGRGRFRLRCGSVNFRLGPTGRRRCSRLPGHRLGLGLLLGCELGPASLQRLGYKP